MEDFLLHYSFNWVDDKVMEWRRVNFQDGVIQGVKRHLVCFFR